MEIKYGDTFPDGATICTGCLAVVRTDSKYIMLSLDNRDGTLESDDLCYAYFHDEHCVALMIKHAEEKL